MLPKIILYLCKRNKNLKFKVMDVTLLERLITSVGFPIVMCIVLAYYIVKLMGLQNQELKELRKAINDNTNVLGQIQTIIKLLSKNEK